MSCEQPAVVPVRCINKSVVARDKPYLDERPSLKIERLNETYSYAFNYAKPNGVILLTDRAKEFLQRYLSNSDVDTNINLPEAAKNKLLRFLNPISPLRPQTRTYWIQVTDSCNLGCFYCYISEIDRYRSIAREVLSSETAQLIQSRVLDEARINGIRRIHFKFAGGEPTLALSAVESFCELARATFPSDVYELSFAIITNGTCSTTAFLALVKKYNMNVSISIDGFEELHNKTRHLGPDFEDRDTWKLLWETANKITEIGVRPFFLHTLTPSNIRGLDLLQEFINGNGWGFRISLMRLEKTPTPNSVARFKNTLISFYKRIGQELPLNLSVNQHVKFAEWNPLRPKTLACGSGRNYFSVNANGEISSCQMSASKPLASLQNVSISDAKIVVQQRPDTRLLANPEERVGGCSSCFFMGTCIGGCPQHTYSVYSTMNHTSPWCEVYGALYPVYVHAMAQHLYKKLIAKSSNDPNHK